jgi:hypothetical protein
MFLHHLKQVLVHRPEKPIDFLIDKFSNPTGKCVIGFDPFYSETLPNNWSSGLFKKRTLQKVGCHLWDERG